MSSAALTDWQSVRRARVAELLDAHRQVGGAGPGRRWTTQQINRSLVLSLAGEFQGFCRHLHDLAVEHFVAESSVGNHALANVQRALLTSNRDLDRGNANPGNLGKDFGRFGLVLWDTIKLVEPNSGPGWNSGLAALNEARNAIAHAQDGPLVVLRSRGYPIIMKTINTWRRSLDGLALTMDDVVADYLDGLFSTGRPW